MTLFWSIIQLFAVSGTLPTLVIVLVFTLPPEGVQDKVRVPPAVVVSDNERVPTPDETPVICGSGASVS